MNRMTTTTLGTSSMHWSRGSSTETLSVDSGATIGDFHYIGVDAPKTVKPGEP